MEQFPAVALLGPRQVGKTTLARAISAKRASVYLDLESPADRSRLVDPALYLSKHEDELVILDEVHRAPELFQSLRGLVRKLHSRMMVCHGRMNLLKQKEILTN